MSNKLDLQMNVNYQNNISESDSPSREKFIESRNIGTAGDRDPPLSSILVWNKKCEMN